MRSLLGQRWLVSLVVVLLVAIFLWFVGPYLAIAGVAPLEPVSNRLVSWVLLLLIWGGVTQYRLIRAEKDGTRLAEGLVETDKSDGASDASALDPLGDRFASAIDTLKRSGKISTLYDLPWYVIVGAPGSGKTTALLKSGLEFPLSGAANDVSFRSVAGTRNCDLWIADKAILIDTAGRFATQDADAARDQADWQAFIGLLKRYRQRRPVNGVLVTISVLDLLDADIAEREIHSARIRSRLVELRDQLEMPFPVYVLVTKADRLSGFSAYFDDLSAEERQQVWGFTFPLGESTAGTAATVQSVRMQMDALIRRLQDRLVSRTADSQSAERSALIHSFPAQVAGLQRTLGEFISAAFPEPAPNRAIWLRGVYFTSATQIGTPIDQMLNALAQNFRLNVGESPVPVDGGRSYFLFKTIADVIIPEHGLAGVRKRYEIRRIATSFASYAGVGLLSLLALALMLWSYQQNSSYVSETDALTKQILPPANAPRSYQIPEALPRLNALRDALDVVEVGADDMPFGSQLVLNQGDPMGDAAADAYQINLNDTIGPWFKKSLVQGMQGMAQKPEVLFEYLKAYLMLADPQRLEPEQIRLVGAMEATRQFGSTQARQVGRHIDSWSEMPSGIGALPVDERLVTQARSSLRQAELSRLMFARLQSGNRAVGDKIRLDHELGLGANQLFFRKSGRTLSEELPAFFTRAAFEDFSRSGRLRLLNVVREDSWVLGDYAPSQQEWAGIVDEVTYRYEGAYINNWEELLADLTLRRGRSTEDAVLVLDNLSGPSSPMKALLVLVEEHTNLLRASEPASDAASVLGEMAGAQAAAVLRGGSVPEPGTRVTQHFAAYHQLLEGPPGSTPIDQLLLNVAELGRAYEQAVGDPAASAGVRSANHRVLNQAERFPAAVHSLFSDAIEGSGSAIEATAQAEQLRRYRTEVVLECKNLIGGRYPFSRMSGNDATILDFQQVFGLGGVYESFFQSELASLVDTSSTRWRWRPGVRAPGNIPLSQFQKADQIRRVFFGPQGAEPSVSLELTPESLAADVNRFEMTIDGTRMEYAHGPRRSLRLVWPATSPTGVRYAFETENGRRYGKEYEGVWGLFRMLDASEIKPLSRNEFQVALVDGGYEMRLVIRAGSVRNPFLRRDLLTFSCGN